MYVIEFRGLWPHRSQPVQIPNRALPDALNKLSWRHHASVDDMRLFPHRLKRMLLQLPCKRVRLIPHRCAACDSLSILVGNPVLWPELIEQWQLTPDWARYFDEREGLMCFACGTNLRSQNLALGILSAAHELTNVVAGSLKKLCEHPRIQELEVAEINSAGALHGFLSHLPKLHYSEFASRTEQVPSENLLALSYPESRFDLVITSESLEHVPDISRALSEIHRVLKPGGFHVFTVPVVWDGRRTRQRASITNERVVYHLPPSYHGAPASRSPDFLVFYEFGSDFLERCKEAKFEVRLLSNKRNPALKTFIARKPA